MMVVKDKIILVWMLFLYCVVNSQELQFIKKGNSIPQAMERLAKSYALKEISQRDLYRAQLVSGNYTEAIETIDKLKVLVTPEELMFLNHFALFAEAKASKNFNKSFKNKYEDYIKKADDLLVIDLDISFVIRDRTSMYIEQFNANFQKTKTGTISMKDAQNLIKSYFFKIVFSSTKDIVAKEIEKDHNRRYLINNQTVLTTKDKGEVSIVTVRRRGVHIRKESAILAHSIYAEKKPLWAMLSASKGYTGVISNTRGKRLSRGVVIPFEYEQSDVNEVMDWIIKQPWSNQKIGMYGGSYDGFTQWASLKKQVHPALKTIVPSVAIAPGIDYPMENNVLHNFSYNWYFMVTNNKYLDTEAAGDFKRWNKLKNTWYTKGLAFTKLDSLDGQVNKLFTKYMQHPSYDDYWKNMIPYKNEFAKIDLPILTITGYYDDSQRGAMYYFNEHHKYVKNPNHYLLIGPYDHWTAQDKPMEHLRNYKLDKTALFNIRYELVYQWFDYILKGKEKPVILKDKVNFQVMDTNTWMHKPSLKEMTNDTLKFHLSAARNGAFYKLQKTENTTVIPMEVDFKDRTSMHNTEYYPWPLERKKINLKDGLIFKSEPMERSVIINGSFFGELEFKLNKKDVDYSVIVYELTPENKYFHLSYYIGRASFAANREHRNLLVPNQKNTVQFSNSKIVSKKIKKGSRIVIVVNVNKNNNAAINYGTGKDVSKESIKDAAIPLQISFTGKSRIGLPIWRN